MEPGASHQSTPGACAASALGQVIQCARALDAAVPFGVGVLPGEHREPGVDAGNRGGIAGRVGRRPFRAQLDDLVDGGGCAQRHGDLVRLIDDRRDASAHDLDRARHLVPRGRGVEQPQAR